MVIPCRTTIEFINSENIYDPFSDDYLLSSIKNNLFKLSISIKNLFNEVLPSIRKTGSFETPKLIHNQFVILNEKTLHQKVVDFIRNMPSWVT